MPDQSTKQRRLAAIMFTDMVGYSSLSQRDETLAGELLEEHRAILRGFFSEHQGTEIKTMGDGFLVEFSSALAAVRCAIDSQLALAERNRDQSSDRQIRIRIGIHVGDVIRSERDIEGDDVNIAARIEPLADPGGICISSSVRDRVENKIKYALVQLIQPDLKNIRANVQVFKVVLDGTSAVPSSNPTSEKPPTKSELFGCLTIVVIAVSLILVCKRAVQPKPNLSIELLAMPGIYELRVINDGKVKAEAINVEVAAWQWRSPRIEFQTNYPVRDLIAHSDSTIVDVFGPLVGTNSNESQSLFWRNEHGPISGYLSITWHGCPRPRSWAFYVPSRGKQADEIESSTSRERMLEFSGPLNPWPLIEFPYPDEIPRIGQCVDYPKGVLVAANNLGGRWSPKTVHLLDYNSVRIKQGKNELAPTEETPQQIISYLDGCYVSVRDDRANELYIGRWIKSPWTGTVFGLPSKSSSQIWVIDLEPDRDGKTFGTTAYVELSSTQDSSNLRKGMRIRAIGKITKISKVTISLDEVVFEPADQ